MKKKIYAILSSRFAGRLIHAVFRGRVPNVRYRNQRFLIPMEYTIPEIAAMVFWGFYESAEIRMVNKYINGKYPVIEIGGSLGIVSSAIAKKMKGDHPLVVVEVNENLIGTIERNLKHASPGFTAYSVLNRAIHYTSPRAVFEINSNNTAGSEVFDSENNDEGIEAVTLAKIAGEYGMELFTLVSDIEGNEYELLKHELDVLKERCVNIIIELHRMKINKDITSTIENLIGTLNGAGFITKEVDGEVYYFVNSRYLHLI